MAEEFDEYLDAFREEAGELLGELEKSLLDLEENPTEKDQVDAVFRVMHTLKGGGGMFGLDTVTEITHKAETAFDAVRNGKSVVTIELIDLTLKVCDLIRVILENPKHVTDEIRMKIRKIIDGYDHLSASLISSSGFVPEDKSEKKCQDKEKGVDSLSNHKNIFRVKFHLKDEVVKAGTKPGELITELTKLGECRIISKWNDIQDIDEADPELRFSKWDLIISTDLEISEIRGVFIFIENDCKVQIEPVDDSFDLTLIGNVIVDKSFATKDEVEDAISTGKGAGSEKRVGEILIDAGLINEEERDLALKEQELLRQELKIVTKSEQIASTNLISSNVIEPEINEAMQPEVKTYIEKEADVKQKKADEIKEILQPEKKDILPKDKIEDKQTEPSRRKEGEFVATSIRVPSAKLDALVDLVSELVTVQAGLSQTAESRNDSELLLIAEEVERLTSELRDNTMGIRMLDIGTLFSKFKRLVRDLSTQVGKKVDITTDGEDTELDKNVIEQLNDPLLHLIRNSIDHGIESGEQRIAAGKSEKGNIRLSASQAGSDVLIKLSDDGKGLDCEAIKRKARERGFMGPTEELPESKLYEFLFMPGFSTAQVITNLSGRGVGLDVVKRSLENLRGSLDLETRKGEGTTFIMKLPLTLAIIDGLLVIIGDQYFILPLISVVECVELTKKDIEEGHGSCVANVRGELIPYVNLRERFMISGERGDIEQIVITGSNDKRVGFVVDKVIGKHQTVIKALGRVYKDIEGVSGATILGDGTVALILDIPNLIKGVEKEELHVRR